MIQYISNSELDTINFARNYASSLKLGDILTIEGDLGAGKTIFAKGIAQGLGISEVIDSPTFTILKSYPFAKGLFFHHIDAYRLEKHADIYFLEECFSKNSITLVEWPTKIEPIVPEIRIKINIKVETITKRKITLQQLL